MEKDVGRLEIPVQNVLVVELRKGTLELGEDLEGLSFGQLPLLFDVLGQCPSVAELIDEVVVVGGPEHLDELDDVGVVDLGKDGDLVVGELAELGSVLELFDVHDLDCVVLFGLPIFGLVDVSVLPLPDFLQKDVVLYDLVHVL